MTQKTPERIDAIDLMKWLCAWLVVTIHTRPFYPYSQIADLYISQGVCRFAVPMFFAASGFLLFRSRKDPRSERKKLIRYGKRVLILYCTWTLIYWGCLLPGWIRTGKLDLFFVLDLFRRFALEASHYHLWYLLATLYAIPAVYLLHRGGRVWQIGAIVLLWPLRCLQYAYRWTGVFSEQFRYMQRYCDVLPNAVLCAVPLMTLGVLAAQDHPKCSNRIWGQRTAFWLLMYFAELSIAFCLSEEKVHFEFLFSTPVLIHRLFCWVLTCGIRFGKSAISFFLSSGSEWIYCVNPLVILVFGCFNAGEGLRRYLVVCFNCFVTSVCYAYIRLGKEYKNADNGLHANL